MELWEGGVGVEAYTWELELDLEGDGCTMT